jgi:hypothetical protein
MIKWLYPYFIMTSKMHRNSDTQQLVSFVIFLIVVALFNYAVTHYHPQTSIKAPSSTHDTRYIFAPTLPTKNSGCAAINDLPDPACTPGAAIPTATKDQICVSGYSSTVRNVSASEKDAVFAEYGITSHAAGEYEVDHLISLELGGSNDIANLWPEAANPTPGFHQKDEVENTLHSEICAGSIDLGEVQKNIATNWLQFYTVR